MSDPHGPQVILGRLTAEGLLRSCQLLGRRGRRRGVVLAELEDGGVLRLEARQHLPASSAFDLDCLTTYLGAAHKQAVPHLVLSFWTYSARHRLAFVDVEGRHLRHDLFRFGGVDVASFQQPAHPPRHDREGAVSSANAVDPTNDRPPLTECQQPRKRVLVGWISTGIALFACFPRRAETNLSIVLTQHFAVLTSRNGADADVLCCGCTVVCP